MKKISPLLKKKQTTNIPVIKMSFLKENHMWVSHILMYEITLGCLEKVSQLGWIGVPTTLSPFLLEELSMVQINDWEDS